MKIYLSTVHSQVTHILRYSSFFDYNANFWRALFVENYLPDLPNKIIVVAEWNSIMGNGGRKKLLIIRML